MQTIYTTSARLGVGYDHVVDLNEYRRSMGLEAYEPSGEELEVSPLLWARESEERAPRTRRRAMGLSAWLLDICASAGVVAMTAAFTLQLF